MRHNWIVPPSGFGIPEVREAVDEALSELSYRTDLWVEDDYEYFVIPETREGVAGFRIQLNPDMESDVSLSDIFEFLEDRWSVSYNPDRGFVPKSGD